MSTRSTVTINAGTPERYLAIHLYRHWDGGPWGNGVDLAAALRRLERRYPRHPAKLPALARELATELIRSGDYEVTDQADRHGDRQWHYGVFLWPGGLGVSVGEIPIGKDKIDWQFDGPLSEFRDWVAGWLRRVILPNLRQRRRDRQATA